MTPVVLALRDVGSWAKTADGEETIAGLRSMRIGALRDKLQPGDILVSSQPRGKGVVRRVSKAIEGAVMQVVQRSPYVHSMVYAGRGDVADITVADRPRIRTLREAVKGINVVALRPDVSRASRRRAAEKMRSVVESVRFRTLGVLKPALSDLIKFEKTRAPIGEEVCSTVIAKAYRPEIVPGKSRDAVMPVDFIRSSKTDIVGVYRHD